MVSEQTILAAQRLHDDLVDLRTLVRRRYTNKAKQVTAEDIRKRAAQLAEVWLIEIATDNDVTNVIGSGMIADLNVHFQRILTFAEHATQRLRYEAEFRAVLNGYNIDVLVPLKRSRGQNAKVLVPQNAQGISVHSAFIGQSFALADKPVNQCVFDMLEALGMKPVTGEQPRAKPISDKVKHLIEGQSIFVGIFTRRDKLARKPEWTTSTWVIDEKAYALGLRKQLILLKEEGVGSIGGIQGDYEFIEFSRDSLEVLTIKLAKLFELTNKGLQK